MGMALEAPTWPAIGLAEAQAILSRFPAAGHAERVSWHSPRPFSAAALIESDRGHFFLKRHHPALRPPAALAEEQAFTAHLRSAGLTVPEVLTTQDGAGAVAQDGWTYELLRKAPGLDLYRDRQTWTPFVALDHAHAAGVALGRLHKAARGFAGAERGTWPLVSSFTIVPARDPVAAAQAYVAARPALSGFLADKPWRQELARLFAALDTGAEGSLASRLEGQPRLWTHNDWHPSNLLWTAEGSVSAVFDFGLAAPTCALHDLATAIERTAIPWLGLTDGEEPDLDAALAILAGYRTVMPLARDDVETVARLLPLVHVEFALSEADYFAGILADRNQANMAWQDYLIDHADWFLTPPGGDFLRRLETGVPA